MKNASWMLCGGGQQRSKRNHKRLILESFWAWIPAGSSATICLQVSRMQEEYTVRSLRDTSKHLYSVAEICALTGVTRKTLFYYDKTDLLKPVRRTGSQNFKEYDAESLLRLRTILMYREAGLHLTEITSLLDDPECDRLEILKRAMSRVIRESEITKEQISQLQLMIDAVKGETGYGKNTSDVRNLQNRGT